MWEYVITYGRLEGNVAEDVDADARAGLQSAEAGGAAIGDGSVVDEGSRNGDARRADAESEGGEGGGAGVDVTAIGVAVGGAGDLGVVCLHNGGGEVQEGGTGVSNASDAGG